MRQAETKATEAVDSPTASTARVEVSDFGPIANASVDLRPLTVFVGPSNSGKTYLATLLYAVSRSFGGFPRYPGPSSIEVRASETNPPSEEEWISLAKSLATPGRSVRLSDFPKIVRARAQSQLERVVSGEEGLLLEIKRCFDLEILSDLVRWPVTKSDARISVSITEGDQRLWSFQMGIGNAGKGISNRFTFEGIIQPVIGPVTPVSSRCQLANPNLMLPKGRDFQSDYFSDLLNSHPASSSRDVVNEIYSRARNILRYNSVPRETYYMPAARSGIMQSHRVISSSLVSRATRAGLEHFPALPTLSGMVTDFLEHLILYDDSRKFSSSFHPRDRYDPMWRRQSQSRDGNSIEQLANELEYRLLGGAIRNRSVSSDQYPDFIFVPNESEEQLSISRSSSMVSELAPIVLFLRRNILPRDMLIIEEPEAHLHPAAQTQMARILAKLARLGVRVVVTTHSDWLLKQIANLIRLGEWETDSRQADDQGEIPNSIQAKDVGVWLFQKSNLNQGSIVKEIAYDRIDGVEPEEYADVDEELYNESAKIQNLLDDRENGGLI